MNSKKRAAHVVNNEDRSSRSLVTQEILVLSSGEPVVSKKISKELKRQKIQVRRGKYNLSKDTTIDATASGNLEPKKGTMDATASPTNANTDPKETTTPVVKKLPNMRNVSRKKLPFVEDDDPTGRDICLTGTILMQLMNELRGKVGYQAIFNSATSLSTYMPLRTTRKIQYLQDRLVICDLWLQDFYVICNLLVSKTM